MKLVCSQSDLNSKLSLVSRAVPSRPSQPVLANVKLSADVQTQEVSLTAFDLSLGIRASFRAQVEESGELALPAKLLNDIVSRLPSGELTLDDHAGNAIATLTCNAGRYTVRGMNAEEFPELPDISSTQPLELPAHAIMQGLRGCLFATSDDETKQVLTGVHLTINPDSLDFAATDGHRLAVVSAEQETQGEPLTTPLEVTIPARALRELEKMAVSAAEGNLALYSDAGQVVFELPGQRITSRTLEGQYPNYNQLIPKSFERRMNLDRRQLLSAVERVAVLADQKNNIVKFSLDADTQELTLSVEAADVGSGKESMEARISGENLDIAFNVKYLTEAIKAIPSQELQMELNHALSPVILSPLGGLKMTCLVMPVQLRS